MYCAKFGNYDNALFYLIKIKRSFMEETQIHFSSKE